MVNTALPAGAIEALVQVALVLVFCTQAAPTPETAPLLTDAETLTVDGAGPALVTVYVYVTDCPAFTGFGEPETVTPRSAVTGGTTAV
jgi:hypothetical protein